MLNLNNKNQFTKRALTSVLAFAMITQLSSNSVQALAAELNKGDEKLKIAVLSDPHYFPKEFVTNTDNEDYKNYMAKELYLLAESAEIFEAALKLVAEDRPDFLLIPGDMTKNGETLGTERVAKILNQFEKETGIDVFIINGNHDIYDYAFAFNGENGNRVENVPVVSAEQYLSLYSNFGYSEENELNDIVYFGDNKNEVTETLHPELSYVTKLKDGYVLLSLNSQLYSKDEEGNITQADGGFNEDLLSWAEKQIKEAEKNGDTVIAMSHHGILSHSLASELSEGGAVVNNWEDVATRFADAGLRYIFTGHMHENDIAEFTTAKGNTIYDIETGSTAGYGSPVRTVEFEKSSTNEVKETVTVSSKSVKSTESIDNLQDYIYDFIYKDSKYLEIKLSGALDSIVNQIANISLEELIFGKATMTDVLENSFEDSKVFASIRDVLTNNTLSNEEKAKLEEFDFAEKLAQSLAQELDGTIVDTEEYGEIYFNYDIENNEVVVHSNSRGIEEKLNIEAFLRDIVQKIDKEVLNKETLTTEISNLLTNIFNIEVFETEDGEKKVLRDVVNLFLIDHFVGAEDLSGWPQELLNQLATGEGISQLIDGLIDNVLNLLPELLNKVKVDVKTLTSDFVLQVAINAVIGKDKSLYNALTKLNINLIDVVKKPISEYLDSYITPSFEKQMGVLIGDLIYGLAGDDTKDDEIDGLSRVITYKGQIPQEPTVENGLLPHLIAVTFGEDETSEKAFSWYTGKNVTTNEIQIVKAKDATVLSNGEVDFSNAIKVQATSEIVKRAFPTIDLGLIAITKDKELTRHQVLLEGLQPGTKYYYKVGNADNGVYSDIATFETAAVNDNSFTFLNFSDTQSMLESEYEGWQSVVNTAFNMYPQAKFVTHAGDMVDNGKNELQWQWFLNKPQEDLMNTTFVGASGNHEESGDYSQVNHFNIQDLPEQDLTTGAYYKVDYGNVLVMVINTNNLGEDNGLTEEQVQWIKDTATASDAKWKVIQTHKAPYSNGSHYADEDVVAIRAQLDSIVTELGIDLVLEGHDHTYARTNYLVNGEVEDVVTENREKDGVNYETAINPEGTMYAITGTSGVKFYKPQETGLPIAVTEDIEVPVFAAITVESNMMYYNAYTVDTVTNEGTLLDTFAIEKSSKVDEVAPIITGVENGGKYIIDKTIMVSDNEELETVTINGVKVENKYEIVPSNEDTEYEVVAIDKSGNKSVVKFTMRAVPNPDNITYGQESVTLINEIKAEFEVTKNTLYSERVAYYNDLILALEEAYSICEAVIEDFVGKVEKLPLPEAVTVENVKEIKGVLAIYKSLSLEEKAALSEEVKMKIEALELAIQVQSITTVDQKVSVKFIDKNRDNSTKGYFDLGTTIVAKALENGEFEVRAILDNVNVVTEGLLEVSIDLGEITYGENHKLYLVSMDGLTTTEVTAQVIEGKLVFQTEELGKFKIIKVASEEQKSELVALINKAKDIDTAKYTAGTVSKLNDAIEKAEQILDNEAITAKELVEVIAELNSAIEGLEEKVVISPVINKAELIELIDKLVDLDTSIYTDITVNIFNSALEKAKNILANNSTTQSEVNEAIKDLREAFEGLEEKEKVNNSDETDSGSDKGNTEGTGSTESTGTTSESELPETGGRNSLFTLALGALTAIGGVLTVRKKNKK